MTPENPKYDLKRQFSLMVEKTISTFVQVFITVFVASDTIGADTAQAAALAGIAAGGSALLGALPVVPDGLPFYTDLFFRVVRTYGVAAGTLFFAANNSNFELSVSAAQAALLAAIPAALTVAKGLVAARFGATNSAALLPSQVDPASFALAA